MGGACVGKAAALDIEIAGGQGRVMVVFDSAYLDRFDLESVVPEPIDERATAARTEFTFAAGTETVSLQMVPNKIGVRRGQVSTGDTVSFRQVVWP